jgi:hypothetical protein
MLKDPLLKIENNPTITSEENKYTINSHRNLAFSTDAEQDSNKELVQYIVSEIRKNFNLRSTNNSGDESKKITITIDKSPGYLAMTKNDGQRFSTQKGLQSYWKYTKKDLITYATLNLAVVPAMLAYFLEDAIVLRVVQYFFDKNEGAIGSAITARTIKRALIGGIFFLNALNFSWHELGNPSDPKLTAAQKKEIIKKRSQVLQMGYVDAAALATLLAAPLPVLLLIPRSALQWLYDLTRFPGEPTQVCYYLLLSTLLEQTLKSWLYATDQVAIAANTRGSRLLMPVNNIFEKVLEISLATLFLYTTHNILSLPIAASIAPAAAAAAELLYLSLVARVISLSEVLGKNGLRTLIQHLRTNGLHKMALIYPKEQLRFARMLYKRGLPEGLAYLAINSLFPISLMASAYIKNSSESFNNSLALNIALSVTLLIAGPISCVGDSFSAAVSELLTEKENPLHRIRQFGNLALLLMSSSGLLLGTALLLSRTLISQWLIDSTLPNYDEIVNLTNTLLTYTAFLCLTEFLRHSFNGLMKKFSPTAAAALDIFSMFVINNTLAIGALVMGLGAKGAILSLLIASAIGAILNGVLYAYMINKRLIKDVYTTKTLALKTNNNDNNAEGNSNALNIKAEISAPTSILQCLTDTLQKMFEDMHPNLCDDDETTAQDQSTNSNQTNTLLSTTATQIATKAPKKPHSWYQSVKQYFYPATASTTSSTIWTQPRNTNAKKLPPSSKTISYGTTTLRAT